MMKNYELTAANLLIKTIDSVYNDLINNNGLTYKSCIQEMASKNNQLI